MIPVIIYGILGLPFAWAAGELVASKGDPYGAIVAIITGSVGLGLVSLYQRFRMAALAVEAESRKFEMSGLNDRIDGQDEYIRELEKALRETSREAERWKTLYSQVPGTTTITTNSPKPSDPK